MKANLILILALSLMGAGCAKSSVSPTQQQTSVTNLLGSSVEPPGPGTSYSSTTALSVLSTTHAGYLLATYLNPSLGDLQESSMHLEQVMTQGQRSNGSMKIVHQQLGATLVGSPQTNGTITYSYFIGNTNPYFTAIAKIDGSGGNANFANNTRGQVTVQWSVNNSVYPPTRTVTFTNMVQPSTITFVETLDQNGNTASTTFTGNFPGNIQAKGSWSYAAGSGGWYSDSTGNQQKCFDSGLNDIACPPSVTNTATNTATSSGTTSN